MEFNDEQIQRYSRHIILPEVGGKGQKKLGQARILIVGAGGLGSPAGLYLAAAGIGTIGIIDGDTVDLSNLHRQVLHHTPDVNQPKVDSAREKMNAINPNVKIITYHERLTAGNAMDLLKDYDVVLDGTDNFSTKFLINDACFFTRRPLVHGGILRFDGQVFTIIPGETACYRCIHRQPPPTGLIPSCQEAGVLGVLAGIIGTIQATEVLKLVLGIGRPLTNRWLIYDALSGRFREARVRRQENCPLCGPRATITELSESEQVICEVPAGTEISHDKN